MAQTVATTINTLLQSVQEAVEDPEATFKLRTARQLVVLCGEQQEVARETLQEADIGEEALTNLEQLGYLE